MIPRILHIRQLPDSLSPSRNTPHYAFTLSSLHIRPCFHQSRDALVLPDITSQSEFFESTFASTADIAWITGGWPGVGGTLGRTPAEESGAGQKGSEERAESRN